MISIQLNGGLGNAMFQIATIEWLGKNSNHDVCFSNVDVWVYDLSTSYQRSASHAEEYLFAFPNVNFYKNHDKRFIVKRHYEVPFRYAECGPEDGDLFIGYFQSEKNFPDPAFVKWLFQPSEDIKNKLRAYDDLFTGTTCSIHVRRGNYVNWGEIHVIQQLDYYMTSLNYLKDKGITKFLVFSDDLNWCRNNFVGDQFVFIDEIDYVALFLMSRCWHHIISNSSFAWWGAWLGETPAKTTIAPRMWFGNSLPADHDADIVPERWLKI